MMKLEKVYEEIQIDIVRKLCKRFDLDEKECIKALKKKDAPIPFTGHNDAACCQNLDKNMGLYTQCQNPKEIESEFCGKCKKAGEYGSMEDRMRQGILDFKDKKGNKPIAYEKILKKLDITREEAELSAMEQGITIPEIHWLEEKKNQGRPKKIVIMKEIAEPVLEDLFAKMLIQEEELQEEAIVPITITQEPPKEKKAPVKRAKKETTIQEGGEKKEPVKRVKKVKALPLEEAQVAVAHIAEAQVAVAI